jgi:hypothetical protein
MKLIINIIIGAVVIGALYLGFQAVMNKKTEPAPTVTVASATSPATQYNDFLALLVAVKGINLEATIFDDPVFQGLQNFRQPLPVRNRGRLDPFMPVNGRASSVSTATSSAR